MPKKRKKASHFMNFVRNTSTSSPKLWKYINPYLNPNKTVSISSSDLFHSCSSNSPQDIANIFANFFESIINKFIFISISSCFDYTHNHFQSNTTLSSYRNDTKSIFHPVDEEDLKKILVGISGIKSAIIKHSVDELIKPRLNKNRGQSSFDHLI